MIMLGYNSTLSKLTKKPPPNLPARNRSIETSSVMRNSIIVGSSINIHAHNEHSKKITQIAKLEQDEKYIQELDSIIQNLPNEHQDFKKQLSNISKYKCSSWLSANPWEDEFFVLTPEEF